MSLPVGGGSGHGPGAGRLIGTATRLAAGEWGNRRPLHGPLPAAPPNLHNMMAMTA